MCIFTACNESSNDYLRPGELFPKADKGTIFVGESVLFTDYSTRVESRRWSFEGGNPSSSEEQQVEVNYAVAGSYDATLEITFEDGSTVSENLTISVNNEYVPLVNVEGPTYVFYSEDQDLPQDHPAFTLNRSGVAKVGFVGGAFEGNEAINVSYDPDREPNTFIMLQTNKVGTADLTEYIDGYLNLAMKSTSSDPILVRIEGGGANSSARVNAGDYGFERDGSWHFISIPIADVLADIATEDGKLALLGSFDQFRLRNVTGAMTKETFDFTVDFIFFSVNKPTLN
ncbi:MAG: hypothetical protein GX371_11215 [Bacteroidales bacterium]|nr:hypothetical protein [Bacteroidales bacterium]